MLRVLFNCVRFTVLFLYFKMTGNGKARASKAESFLQWEDWVVLLTGGMVTSGAIGWIVYRSFKSQLDYKAIKTIVRSFVGGMGIYFTSSAIIFMYQKSSHSGKKSLTSKKDESNLPVSECEISPCKGFIGEVNELDIKFAYETNKFMECKDLDKKISQDIIQEAAEVPFRSKDMTKRLNNRRGAKNGLQKQPTDNQVGTCYKEDIGIGKAKVKEEIISCISEMKGYVQGTIDPLSSARNLQSRSSEISDEMYQQIVTIVKEYANTMIPKLEQVIDGFIDSMYKSGEVHSDIEHGVEKASETLGVPGKDICTIIPPKIDTNRYNDSIENRTKNSTHINKNWQQSKNASTIRLPESVSSSSLPQKNNWTEISGLPSSIMARFESPSTESIPFKVQPLNKLEYRAVKKLKNETSNQSVKLKLDQEQMKSLNILKSEL